MVEIHHRLWWISNIWYQSFVSIQGKYQSRTIEEFTMTSYGNANYPATLPILKVDNYENWCKQMKVLFRCQGLWDLVKDGVEVLGENASEEEKKKYIESEKLSYKTLFIIHQCVSPDNFEKVSDSESAKEAWEILEKSFGGAEKVKEVGLQTHKRTYELLQMEYSESISDFFTRVTKLVNQIKICGEALTTRAVVSKILRSLAPKFDHIVVAVEEGKELSKLTKEGIKGTLESHK